MLIQSLKQFGVGTLIFAATLLSAAVAKADTEACPSGRVIHMAEGRAKPRSVFLHLTLEGEETLLVQIESGQYYSISSPSFGDFLKIWDAKLTGRRLLPITCKLKTDERIRGRYSVRDLTQYTIID